MNDIAHCDGLRWIDTTLPDGTPVRAYVKDCPRRKECERFRLNDHWSERAEGIEAAPRVSYVESPEHGADCQHFLPIQQNEATLPAAARATKTQTNTPTW